jgi:hypothetical protein
MATSTETEDMVRLTLMCGAMEVHRTGCADIARSLRSHRTASGSSTHNVINYAGATLAEAVLAADTDMADWFGQDVYEDAPAENAWTISTCRFAPCVAHLFRGCRFDDHGRLIAGDKK